VNTSAIPAELLEAEIFGHVRGGFTGAAQTRKGLVTEASGGTLLLDEIGDMPLGLQAKILRVLQLGEVRPVGSDRSHLVDGRVILPPPPRRPPPRPRGPFPRSPLFQAERAARRRPAAARAPRGHSRAGPAPARPGAAALARVPGPLDRTGRARAPERGALAGQ